MDKTIKIVAAILAVVVVASMAVLFSGTPAQKETAPTTLYFFYGEECPHCHNVMPFINNMTKKYPDVDIRLLEIWHNETNQQIYQQAFIDAGATPAGVPAVVFGKSVLIGEREIPAKLEGLIQDYLKKKS
jgi:ABC-type glycerol-3-phosphate transport system substrate-binding protein